MEQFIKFLHFVNSEKRFEFIATKTFARTLTEKEYNELPFDQEKLLKYNGYTLPDFKAYIDGIKDKIENEINDVFDSANKELITETHNKMLRLIELLQQYKKLDFDKVSIQYPNHEFELIEELPEKERKEIINFLKIESDLVYATKELIRKQELQFGVKVISSKLNNVTGFKFNTQKVVDPHVIYLLLEGSLLSCDYKAFRRVFNCEPLKTLQKIKWLLKHRDKCNKRALIYFLSQPIFESVDKDEDLRAKILFSFADANGKTFDKRALNENISQYNKAIAKIESEHNTSSWKTLVDDKVEHIQRYLQS